MVYLQPMKKHEETSSKLTWNEAEHLAHLVTLQPLLQECQLGNIDTFSPLPSVEILPPCSWLAPQQACTAWNDSTAASNIFTTPTAPFHLAFISQVLLLCENWERGRSKKSVHWSALVRFQAKLAQTGTAILYYQ